METGYVQDADGCQSLDTPIWPLNSTILLELYIKVKVCTISQRSEGTDNYTAMKTCRMCKCKGCEVDRMHKTGWELNHMI